MLLAFGTDFDPPSRVDVVLLRSHAEYEEFTGEWSLGMLITSGTESLMLLPVSDGDAQVMPTTVAHELVHDLSRYRLLRQPRWVAEGLAGDLENAELSEDGRFAYLGKVPSWAMERGVDTSYLLALDALWEWEQRSPTDEALSRHYRSAWAWSVFLRNRYGERLAEFHRRLGIPEEPRAGLRRRLQRGWIDVLDREMRDYFDKGLNYYATWQLPEVQVEVRELGEVPPEEVHALRIRLLHLALDPRTPEAPASAQVTEELALARAISPSRCEAELEALRLGLTGPDREAAARELVARAPDVARGVADARRPGAAGRTPIRTAQVRRPPSAGRHSSRPTPWTPTTRASSTTSPGSTCFHGKPDARGRARPRALARAPWARERDRHLGRDAGGHRPL